MADEIRASDINTDAPVATPPPGRVETTGDASLGALFRELAQDSSILIRQEIALAKIEMRENMRGLAGEAVKIAIGGGLLLVGLLALTAFLIAGLGALLDGRYWLSALIVGALYAAIGGVLMMRGKSALQESDLKPDQTLRSLQDDKQWAQEEARQVKRDLTS